MTAEVNRIWRLRKQPLGDTTDDVLSFEEESIPEPRAGECLFLLNYLSLDSTNSADAHVGRVEEKPQ